MSESERGGLQEALDVAASYRLNLLNIIHYIAMPVWSKGEEEGLC